MQKLFYLTLRMDSTDFYYYPVPFCLLCKARNHLQLGQRQTPSWSCVQRSPTLIPLVIAREYYDQSSIPFLCYDCLVNSIRRITPLNCESQIRALPSQKYFPLRKFWVNALNGLPPLTQTEIPSVWDCTQEEVLVDDIVLFGE